MNVIRLLRRCHLPLLMLLGFSQMLMLILCRIAPGDAHALALFPVLTAAALMLCAAAPGKRRSTVLFACCAALFAAGRLLLSGSMISPAAAAGCTALLAAALFHADKSPAQASPMFYFLCVFAQCAALFLLYQADEAVRRSGIVQGAFYLWLLLFLLAFNRISLNNATFSRYRLSAGMAHAGTALTLCVFALALLLCAMPAVVSGVIWLFIALRDGSIRLLLWLASLLETQSTGGGVSGSPAMLPIDIAPVVHEASLLSIILEKIAAVFSVIVLIAGCAALLRLLLLVLMRLARRILLQLKRYAAAVTEDYEDEITDTCSEEGARAFLPPRRRAKPRQAYPDTPAGRIRRRYAQLLARHSEWPGSSTARENLCAEAASLYERARYSNHALTQEEAQRFEQETQ